MQHSLFVEIKKKEDKIYLKKFDSLFCNIQANKKMWLRLRVETTF